MFVYFYFSVIRSGAATDVVRVICLIAETTHLTKATKEERRALIWVTVPGCSPPRQETGQQEHGTIGYTASAFRKQSDKCVCLAQGLLFNQFGILGSIEWFNPRYSESSRFP